MWMWLVGLAVGAAAGGISIARSRRLEREAVEQQQRSAWQQYQLGKDYSDRQFSIQKEEALDQLAAHRRNLDTQLGLSMDDYNTGLLGQAFGIQDARIANESSIGMSRAAEGASGTRGNEANELVRAYAEQGLERNIELQDRQNSNYLNQMITGANMTSDAIARERDSWLPGGYKARQKDALDAYNLSIANLGQDNFQWQLDLNSDWRQVGLDYTAGIFGGASSGMNWGAGIDQYRNAWNSIGKAPRDSF